MDLRDTNLLRVIEKYYEKCNYMGIPTIRWSEGQILYSVTYTYLVLTGRREGYIVDAGAGAGFSTIWMAYAVVDAGTRHSILAIDYYKRNLDMFKELVEKLGLKVNVETRVGDACQILGEYPEEVDVLFIDVEKDRYIECVEAVKNRIKPGGIIMAHNMLFPYTRSAEKYLNYMSRILGWKTTVIPSEMGIGLTVKSGGTVCLRI